MPELSIFTPCGLLELSGDITRAERLYYELIASYGPAFFPQGVATPGTYMEARVFATAMALARAHATLVRAGNQRHPTKAFDLLTLLAADWGVIPSSTDTIPSLQAKVAAAKQQSRGARFEAVVAGLQAILGENFLSFRPVATTEATVYPQWPSGIANERANPTRAGAPAKWAVLVDPVAVPGTPVAVTYTNLDISGDEVFIAAGDVVMMQPENTALAERVTVLSASTVAGASTSPVLAFWEATSSYAVGALAEPVPANGYAYVCTTAGTTAGAQPDWPPMPGLSISDGSLVWTCTGLQQTVVTGETSSIDVAIPTVWPPVTDVPIGFLVQPSTENGLYYACTTTGITSVSEPTWPTVNGVTIQDGGVTWTCQGFIGAVRQFTAIFQEPHDAGATVTTMSWPFQWSTQRFNFVVVNSLAAVNANLRRQVNVFMAKAMRGVSEWSIVEPATVTALGGTLGPFALSSSPIGTVPLGLFAFNDVP